MFLRDPEAPTSDGFSAYYAFEGEVKGEAPDSGTQDPRSEVVVAGLGLRYSIPLGCLHKPKAGIDEFLETRPPAVCWKQAPPSEGIGRNDKGRPMPMGVLASLVRGDHEGQSVHRLARNLQCDGGKPTGASRADGERSTSHILLDEWARQTSHEASDSAPEELLQNYMRRRVEGRSDREALADLATNTRGVGELMGVLAEAVEELLKPKPGRVS